MREAARRGPYDEIDTPVEATDYLIDALIDAFGTPFKRYPILWDSAPPPDRPNKLAERLENYGYGVRSFPGYDFFDNPPMLVDADVIVTNPPYSIKYKWIKRTMAFCKPAALLMPVTTIGPKAGHEFVTQCRIVLLPKRIDFTGGGAPWFAVAWFLWNWPGEKGLVLGY